jgi:hypothetical protein
MEMDAMVNLELSKEEAEVLLGVLAAERHNEEAEAVCEAVRRRLDEQLASLA